MSTQPYFHPQLGYGFPVSGEFEEDHELLGRGDSRSPVRNTEKAPFRWICQLKGKAYDDSGAPAPAPVLGTGLLIGPRHILTAAHNFWFEDAGKTYRVKSMEVAPGRSYTKLPFLKVNVAGARFPKEYVPGKNHCYDYAILILAENIGSKKYASIKNQPLGWWGHSTLGGRTKIQSLPAVSLLKKTLHTTGYPGDKCGFMTIRKYTPGSRCYRGEQIPGTTELKNCLKSGLGGSAQYGSKGKVLALRPGGPGQFLLYDADTCGGQSGSPVWLQSGRDRILVAIHTGSFVQATGTCTDPGSTGTADSNRAIHINDTVYRNIKQWIAGT